MRPLCLQYGQSIPVMRGNIFSCTWPVVDLREGPREEGGRAVPLIFGKKDENHRRKKKGQAPPPSPLSQGLDWPLFPAHSSVVFYV